MNIVFSVSEGCGTSVKEFVINGIKARLNRFGVLMIHSSAPHCEYEFVGDLENDSKIQLALNEYGITREDYTNVVAILENRLSGGCNLCE